MKQLILAGGGHLKNSNNLNLAFTKEFQNLKIQKYNNQKLKTYLNFCLKNSHDSNYNFTI